MPKIIKLPCLNTLRILYVVEQLSLRDLAAEYDCSPETVRKRLIIADVKLRAQSFHHGNFPRRL